MKHPDIIRLAVGEIAHPIHVGRIPDVWAAHLQVTSRWVMLSPYSFAKQAKRHADFELHSYESVEWILDQGEVIFDAHEHVLHFIGDMRETTGYLVKVTVKASRSREALFMTSAHYLRERDYQRMKRKALASKN